MTNSYTSFMREIDTDAANAARYIAHILNTPPDEEIFYQVISALPVIGIAVQTWMETTVLNSHISFSIRFNAKERTLEYIDIKNHFKKIGMIRDVVTLAALVGVVVLGFFLHGAVILLGAVGILTVGSLFTTQYFALQDNRKVYQDIQQNGLVQNRRYEIR